MKRPSVGGIATCCRSILDGSQRSGSVCPNARRREMAVAADAASATAPHQDVVDAEMKSVQQRADAAKPDRGRTAVEFNELLETE